MNKLCKWLSQAEAMFLGMKVRKNEKGRNKARYYLTKSQWDRVKSIRANSEVTKAYQESISESQDIDESDDGVSLTYSGPRPLTSKQEAIDFFKVDLEEYFVSSFQCKSWTTTMKVKTESQEGKTTETPTQVTNYGVSLKLLKKPTELSFEYKANPRKIKTQKGAGSVVIPLSDFHIGAYVGDLVKTQDFNFDILCGYLQQIAEDINSDKYENVHLMMLGDFIESFTGLNHINSWKGLHKGSYGMRAVVLAHEVLSEHLYSKIKNLKSVDICSGNHDRITSNNAEDVQGEVAYMLHYLFTKDFKDVESTYSDTIIKRIVDRIGYLGFHGHLGFSKKDTGKIIQDYGFEKSLVEYHVCIQGHFHARQSKKAFKKFLAKYEDIDVVQHDSLDYRKVTAPPLFTGNFYSESLGFTSTAGFTKLKRNKYGKLSHEDITL